MNYAQRETNSQHAQSLLLTEVAARLATLQGLARDSAAEDDRFAMVGLARNLQEELAALVPLLAAVATL